MVCSSHRSENKTLEKKESVTCRRSLLFLNFFFFRRPPCSSFRGENLVSVVRGKVKERFRVTMARNIIGTPLLRLLSRTSSSSSPYLRRAYGNYEEYDVFAGTADTTHMIRINGYDENGFIANGVNIEGGVICLSKLALTWIPKTFDEITPDSLSIFHLLRPAPEILVLGCGRRIQRVSKELRDFLRSNGIKLEAIDSANAASTFNILNEEGRQVAAAMLPQGAT